MPHSFLQNSPSPRVIAHRGLVPADNAASGIAENTRAAFEAAVEAGAVYLESDCHLTRDGVVVLFHDSTLLRVTGDPRAVADVSYDELRHLMQPLGGLLTLEQLLEEFAGSRFNIDVKSDAVAEPAGRIIGAHAERVLLASFDDVRRKAAIAAAIAGGGSEPATSPGRATLIRLLLAVQARSKRLVSRTLSGLDAVQIPERHRGIRVLSPRLIDAVHGEGLEVHVWTVNDAARMRELVALGVDGIITDRADIALNALK